MANAPFLIDKTFGTGVGSVSLAAGQQGVTCVEIPWSGDEGPAGARNLSPQAIRVFAKTDNAAGTGTLQIAFQHDDSGTLKTHFKANFTLTVTALRDGVDGASGYYHMTVVDAVTGRDTFDTLGGAFRNCKMWVVLVASSNIVRVQLVPTRNAG